MVETTIRTDLLALLAVALLVVLSPVVVAGLPWKGKLASRTAADRPEIPAPMTWTLLAIR